MTIKGEKTATKRALNQKYFKKLPEYLFLSLYTQNVRSTRRTEEKKADYT